jgi:lipopolysaccharide/colanic/teichoic acid biosynthesis glycosyltransferase
MRWAFDRLGAAIGLILLAPLFALIALVIKIEDGGPVFYSQLRVGRGFRPFRLLKFRSMIPDADRVARLTASNDPRRTQVGCVLRKYKLDELPQLVNVLKGEMQMVGPRPELERYVGLFPSQYSLLLRDRPGITDPATLAYRREEELLDTEHVEEQYLSVILPRKLRLSVEYALHRSFPSDLRVLLQTVFLATFVSRRLKGALEPHTHADLTK